MHPGSKTIGDSFRRNCYRYLVEPLGRFIPGDNDRRMNIVSPVNERQQVLSFFFVYAKKQPFIYDE